MVIDLGHSMDIRCDCSETGFVMLHRQIEEFRLVLNTLHNACDSFYSPFIRQ